MLHTCVFSPSSRKAPISSVPSSARPSAAEAVGDVLCRVQACTVHQALASMDHVQVEHLQDRLHH